MVFISKYIERESISMKIENMKFFFSKIFPYRNLYESPPPPPNNEICQKDEKMTRNIQDSLFS